MPDGSKRKRDQRVGCRSKRNFSDLHLCDSLRITRVSRGRKSAIEANLPAAGAVQRCQYYASVTQHSGTNPMRILVVALLLTFATPVPAHNYCAKAKCEETKQRIKKIESKMRQGYTASQGAKMEDDLRRLRKIRSKRCR